MFESLKKLFKKPAPVKAGEPISIDITGSGIVINGSRLSLPFDIDRISSILGAPRAVHYETKPEDKAFFDKSYGANAVTDRTNYFWDSIGIKCYTLDSRTVNTFSVELNKGNLDYPNTTETLFKGSVTINGKPWLPQVKAGEDLDVIQQLKLGGCTITAEFTDEGFDQQPHMRDEKSFTGLEVAAAK